MANPASEPSGAAIETARPAYEPQIEFLQGELRTAKAQLVAVRKLLWSVRSRIVYSHQESASDIDEYMRAHPTPDGGTGEGK